MYSFIYDGAGVLTIDLENGVVRFQAFDIAKVNPFYISENNSLWFQPLTGGLSNEFAQTLFALENSLELPITEIEKQHIQSLGLNQKLKSEDLFYNQVQIDRVNNAFSFSPREQEKHLFEKTVALFLLRIWDKQMDENKEYQKISFVNQEDKNAIEKKLGIYLETKEEKGARDFLRNTIEKHLKEYTNQLKNSFFEPGAGILEIESIQALDSVLKKRGLLREDKKLILNTLMQAKQNVEKNNYLLPSRLVAALNSCIDVYTQLKLEPELLEPFQEDQREGKRFDYIIHSHLANYLNSGRRFFFLSRDKERLDAVLAINKALYPLLHPANNKELNDDEKLFILKTLLSKKQEVEIHHKEHSVLGNVVSSRLVTGLQDCINELKELGLVTDELFNRAVLETTAQEEKFGTQSIKS